MAQDRRSGSFVNFEPKNESQGPTEWLDSGTAQKLVSCQLTIAGGRRLMQTLLVIHSPVGHACTQ